MVFPALKINTTDCRGAERVLPHLRGEVKAVVMRGALWCFALAITSRTLVRPFT